MFPTAPCCRKACRKPSMRSSGMRCFASNSRVFIDYFLRLKRNEAGRFAQWSAEHEVKGDDPTDWEQREYFDFF